MVRVIGGIVIALVLTATVVVVRDLTMTRHEHTPPGSRTEVVFRSETATAASSDQALARALFRACEAQVDSELVEGTFVELGDGRYGAELTPALDTYDERELEGCLEDRTLDHVQAVVEQLEPVGS